MKAANGIRRVALIGSSFAAGPDIEPLIEPVAGRSGNNYGEIVARRLGAAVADLAVSGATTDTVLSAVQRIGRRRFPPQLPQIPEDADLIMVTAGGNDLGYLQSIIPAALAGRFDTAMITRPLAMATRLIFGTPTGKDVEVAATDWRGSSRPHGSARARRGWFWSAIVANRAPGADARSTFEVLGVGLSVSPPLGQTLSLRASLGERAGDCPPGGSR